MHLTESELSLQARQDDGKIKAFDQDSKDYVLMIMLEASTVQLLNYEAPTAPQRVQVIRITANDIMSYPVIMDMHFANDVQGLESALVHFKHCGALATTVSSFPSVCDLTTLTGDDVQQQTTTLHPTDDDMRRGSRANDDVRRGNESSLGKSDVDTQDSDFELHEDSAFELHEGVIPLVRSRKVSTDINRSSKSSANSNRINSSVSSGFESLDQSSTIGSRQGSSGRAASRGSLQDATGEGESGAVKSQHQERSNVMISSTIPTESSIKRGQRNYLQDVLVSHDISVGEIDPGELSAKCECDPQPEPPTSCHFPSTTTPSPPPPPSPLPPSPSPSLILECYFPCAWTLLHVWTIDVGSAQASGATCPYAVCRST